jgi:hypothetical protein
MRARRLTAWWGPISALVHPFNAILDSTISQWGGGVTHNTRNWSEDFEDRRGDAAGATPDCPFDTIPLTTWWRGSTSPPALRNCGSNLYQTLSHAS